MDVTHLPIDRLLLAAVIAMILARVARNLYARTQLPKILGQDPQLVDVRTAEEFAGGHAAGCRNIPLSELERGADALDRARWIVVCCASGTRSARAGRRLRKLGFPRVFNAGSWRALP